jgi:hypothetical protein
MIRHFLARHPWVHWVAVGLLAVLVACAIAAQGRRAERARDAWGATSNVLVATADIAPGEPLRGVTELQRRPVAMQPATALTGAAAGATARQRVAAGEIVVAADVLASGRPQEALPRDWVAVAVPGVAAGLLANGDRVSVYAAGAELTRGAQVVGLLPDEAIVGVPRSDAAGVADAAAHGEAVVALEPAGALATGAP